MFYFPHNPPKRHKILFNTLTQWSAIECCSKNANFQEEMFYLISRNQHRLWILKMELEIKGLGASTMLLHI